MNPIGIACDGTLFRKDGTLPSRDAAHRLYVGTAGAANSSDALPSRNADSQKTYDLRRAEIIH